MNPVDQLVAPTGSLNVATETAATPAKIMQVPATYGAEVPGKSAQYKLVSLIKLV